MANSETVAAIMAFTPALIRALGVASGGSVSSLTFTDSIVIGAATTSGVRLDLESGTLAVREGDDSAYANMNAETVYAKNSGSTKIKAYVSGYSSAVYFGAALSSDASVKWNSTDDLGGGDRDTGLARASAGVVAVLELTNNAATNIHQITASSGALSGASYSFTNALPAGAIILGVTLRVTTAITGATSFDVGDGSDVDRYGAGVAVALSTTTAFSDATANPLEWRSAAGNVVLTANGGTFSGGVVRICVHYLTGTAPTS